MESEDIRKRWEAFFASNEEATDALYRTVSLYPEEKTIPIKYEEINIFDHELGSSLLEDPTLTLDIGKGVVLATAREFEDEFKGEINLRPYKLPPYRRVMVKNIRAEHIGKLVTVNGLVRKVQNVMPKIVMAKFRCSRCGSVWTVPQDGIHVKTPMECSKEEGGCGSSSAKAGFNILWHESKYIDTQVTTVQEIAEELIGGEQPQQIDLVLADDLTGRIMPGDKLKITGLIRPKPRRTSHGFMSVLRTYIDVVHVKIDNENKYEDIEFSKEEIKDFQALAKDPKVYEIIKDSLAPELMGLDDIKKTIILQLFGGIRKKSTATKMDLRGDIHVLLVGDPGTGKSQLLKQARGIAPRGIFASGKSSTGAGLCVAPDTLISLSNGELAEIGDFVEQKMSGPEIIKDGVWRQAANGHDLLTVDEGLRMDRQGLEAVWRLRSPVNLFEITTATNKKIKVSSETPLPVRGNSTRMEWVKASELTSGMHLATPRKLPEPDNPIPVTLELVDHDCIVEGAAQFVKDTIEKLKRKYGSVRNIASHFNINENNLYHHWVRDDRRGNPSLGDMLELGKEAGIGHREIGRHVEYISQKHGHRIAIPEKVSEEMLYFAGLIAGDGAICRTGYGGFTIRYSSSSPELMKNYMELCGKLFGITPKLTEGNAARPADARFHSKIVARMLEKMGIPPSPKSSIIDPSSIVQKLPNTHLAAFLKGLFDCDGSCNFRGSGGSSNVELYTSSKNLASKIQILLLRFGIISRIRKRKRSGKSTLITKETGDHEIKSRNDILVLTITGARNLRSFEKHIGFSHPRKRENLSGATGLIKEEQTNLDVIPNVGPLIKEVRESFDITQREIGIKTELENGSFNPSRSYLAKVLDSIRTVVDEGRYEGKKVVLPGPIRGEVSAALKKTLSNRQLANKLGISEYRAYELIHRKGRKPGIPFVILKRACRLLSDKEEGYLANKISEAAGFEAIREELMDAELKLEALQSFVTSDIFWDPIVRIGRKRGPAYIYDLTVKDSHNFVANGLLAHNTAAAVKETTPFGEGVWTLEAGALVLSDMGLAAVDELDKMGKEDRSSMHEAMEQQSISIAKAGITATLQSRCAILAAANPKIGIYDENMRIDENINLPPTLISRFDTIFILQDKPDEEEDAALAKHILGVHRASEISTHRAMLGEDNVQFSKEEEDEAAKGQKPPLTGEFLRKYIAYAKKNYSPVLTEEAMTTIKSFFVDVRTRAKHSAASGAPITARQLEAVIRLGEASAKARLSNNVEHQDIQNGIGTIKNYLNRLFGTEEEWDAISLETAITSKERSLMSFLIETIKKEDTGDKAGVSWKTIEDKAIAEGYTGDSLRKVKNELKRLKKINSIYSPRDGHYRVVRQE